MVLKIAPHCAAPWTAPPQLSSGKAPAVLLFSERWDWQSHGMSCYRWQPHSADPWVRGWRMSHRNGCKAHMAQADTLKIQTLHALPAWLLACRNDCWLGSCHVCPDLKGSPIPMTFGYWFLCWGSQENNINCWLLQQCHCRGGPLWGLSLSKSMVRSLSSASRWQESRRFFDLWFPWVL